MYISVHFDILSIILMSQIMKKRKIHCHSLFRNYNKLMGSGPLISQFLVNPQRTQPKTYMLHCLAMRVFHPRVHSTQ